MRNDLSKVITECYRHKNNKEKRGVKMGRQYKTNDFESLPQKEGMRRPHVLYHNNFEFGENLSPLARVIQKAAREERDWNDFYSELRKSIPKGALGDHVLLHVEGFVVRPHSVENGIVLDLQGREIYRGKYSAVYVDPETGKMKILPPKPPRQYKRDSSFQIYFKESEIEPNGFEKYFTPVVLREKDGRTEEAKIQSQCLWGVNQWNFDYNNPNHITVNRKSYRILKWRRLGIKEAEKRIKSILDDGFKTKKSLKN